MRHSHFGESLKANPSPLSSEFLHTIIIHITVWFCLDTLSLEIRYFVVLIQEHNSYKLFFLCLSQIHRFFFQ